MEAEVVMKALCHLHCFAVSVPISCTSELNAMDDTRDHLVSFVVLSVSQNRWHRLKFEFRR